MKIIPLETVDIPVVSRILARAFQDERLFSWLFPDPRKRMKVGIKLFRLMAERYLPQGICFKTDDLSAAILCALPQREKGSLLRQGMDLFTIAGLFKKHSYFIMRLFQHLEQLRPEQPHLYIEVLGVDPDHQRKGIGTALMQHLIGLCDDNQWICYLESPEHLIGYYESFGFTVRDEFDIPKVNIKVTTMLRDHARHEEKETASKNTD